ncbi:(2Fe-2S)-binding protein [Amycolatopsis pithecellobii]|uniref:2Fe-2S iron-sulfur cluster binding domain-containing protein n=1 Tax=Amycolatopsis pithecellobii TaxID=664692 RepID=A0A6N7Z5G1_9PSEU|nr:(2Fe-2S)-binding protein [Amycolatopsis pithecellobii]MTD54696.1 2Fe-2S iron-sulfur cluster binding domain-containing protein [Amycolatopsis pithecellobii]
MTASTGCDEPPGRTIRLTVNGRPRRVVIEDRQLLADVIRAELHLTGTRIGCYNGDCGACTVRVDSRITKSCLVLAASVDGAEITTIEGIAPEGELGDVQQAFWDSDAFQCGFCVAGQLFAIDDLLDTAEEPSEAEIRLALQGNLCRCTGYVNIVEAARLAARRRQEKGRNS